MREVKVANQRAIEARDAKYGPPPGDGVTIDNGSQPEPESAVDKSEPQVETPPAESAAPSPPRSSPRLVQSAPSAPPRELTPAEAKAKAMEPQRQPISNEPTTTQSYLEWSGGSGSGRIGPKDWGPV